MAEVRLEHVTKRWGSFVGVADFDLTIADREFLVLLGPLRLRQDDGHAHDRGAGGRDVRLQSTSARAGERPRPKDRDVAMVYQSYGLYPNMNVYENIRFPLKVPKVPASEHDARCGAPPRWWSSTTSSTRKAGRALRRPASARGARPAIMREPTVFLMDEPLSNLEREAGSDACADQ